MTGFVQHEELTFGHSAHGGEMIQGFAPLVAAIKRLTKRDRHDWASDQLGACVSKQIRDIRLQRGWTQEQLGDRCGMKQSYIHRLETSSGSLHCYFSTLSRIAAALECALTVRFVSWSEFVVYVLEITGQEVRVCRFEDDEVFFGPTPEEGQSEQQDID